MLFIKVVPENHKKILARCTDLDQKFLDDHEKDRILNSDGVVWYVTPYWIDSDGKFHGWSILFQKESLDKELYLPHGKSETDWFRAARKSSKN